jgi:lysophospholipase L1-like esterase
MKTVVVLLLALIAIEGFLFKSPSKIDYWQSLDQKDSSVAVTPQILLARSNFLPLFDRDGTSTLPLGSRSHARIVMCQESNGMIEYRSDRYGFRNKDEVWDRPVDIVLVGDSFAQGACVGEGYDIASQLSKGGKSILNLGSLGNGALANLAVVSEYVRDLAPRKLLWFYVANDLQTDSTIEEESSLLKAYRDPSFTQSLKYRQVQIDELIGNFLNEQARFEATLSRWQSWLHLTNTQNALTRLAVAALRLDAEKQAALMDYAQIKRNNYRGYAQILKLAKERLPKTQIELVIIPDAGMFSKRYAQDTDRHVEEIRSRMEPLGIPTIDAREAFAHQSGRLEYYSVKSDGTYGHFTPEGYRIVSDYLASVLKE